MISWGEGSRFLAALRGEGFGGGASVVRVPKRFRAKGRAWNLSEGLRKSAGGRDGRLKQKDIPERGGRVISLNGLGTPAAAT